MGDRRITIEPTEEYVKASLLTYMSEARDWADPLTRPPERRSDGLEPSYALTIPTGWQYMSSPYGRAIASRLRFERRYARQRQRKARRVRGGR